jgi:hypothetical protein
MTKAELLANIESAWDELQSAIDGLDEEQLTRLPVTGNWTLKDLLAHLAVWQSRLVTDLFKIERGFTPEWNLTDAQVDALNARFYKEQKDRPLERILDDLYGVHGALMSRLEALSDAALTDPKKHKWLKGKPLSTFVAGDSLEHYREHLPEILAWRRSLEK